MSTDDSLQDDSVSTEDSVSTGDSVSTEDDDPTTDLRGRVPSTADGGPASAATSPAAPRAGEEPERIGPYRVLKVLGKGGMGSVYLVEQTEPIKRRAALKLIRSPFADREMLLRIQAERQALARMNHPNIAQVFEAGSTPEDYPYLVMEYVPGLAITVYCDRHRLDLRQRLELLMAVCGGVQHAHQKGIIHRDLKPSNILVMEEHGTPIPKIIDFGIAKALDHQSLTDGTFYTGERLLGTPAYMSPEVVEIQEGGLDIDTRADVYSLGVLLYELLVGVQPFGGKNFVQVIRNITEEEPQKPSTKLLTLDETTRTELAAHRHLDLEAGSRPLRGDLDWITMKAIARDRTQRYDSAAELAADIGRHLKNQPVLAGPPSAAYRLGKFVRRHRAGVAAAVLVVLALLAGIAGTTLEARRANREAERANREAEVARQVSDFLVQLFEVSDPDRARGNTVTARELLDHGAARVENELGDQPRVQARLMDTIGTVYGQLGLYEEALPLVEEGLEIRRRALGEDHEELADSLFHLAGLRSAQGDYDRAEELLQQALTLREAALGPESPQVAAVLNRLFEVYRLRGDSEKAQPLYERALAIQEKTLGSDHPEVAVSVNGLGELYYDRGDFERAEPLFQRSLEIREKALGSDHRDVAESLNNLADLYRSTGELDRVEPLQQRALAIWEKVLGPEHPDVAASLNNLAAHYRSLGDYARAEPLFQRAREILEKALGPDHPHLSFILNNLGQVRRATGHYDEAEAMFARAREIREAAFGVEHPATAASIHNLALVYRDRGEVERAEALFDKALEIYRATGSADHPRFAAVLQDLAVLYRDHGEAERARPLGESALVVVEEAFAADHPQVLETRLTLAGVQADLGETAAAEELLQEVIAGSRKWVERSASDRVARHRLAAAYLELGDLYRDSGREPEAVDAWQRSAALSEDIAAESEAVAFLATRAAARSRLGR